MSARDPIRHPGNQGLFRALELSVLSTLVGLPLHVHAEGLRGTGKTTIIRSFRRRLPRIERISGCVFNCRPGAPHCPLHRCLPRHEVAALGTEWVPMPFREISPSAKIGTVAGSLDLSRLAGGGRPEVALLPGIIPQAHRGVIFVDEINRLADTAPEIADILLDVMGTKPGRIQVEETGLPGVDLAVSASVWAASNPDEDPGPLGDIRKQLSDRFDFLMVMERPTALDAVRDILRSSYAGHAPAVETPAGRTPTVDTPAASPPPAGAEWETLAAALGGIRVPPGIEDLVASLYVDFGLESLRGVEAIQHGARINCVLEGRALVTAEDVGAVAQGALQHRLDVSTLARVMDYLAEKGRPEGAGSSLDQPRGEPAAPGGDDATGDPTARRGDASVAFEASRTASPPAGVVSGSPDGRPDRVPQNAWSFMKGLLGPRRAPGSSSAPPVGSEACSEAAQAGPSSRLGRATAPRRPGDDDRVVAPTHPARPLSEILREMEQLGGPSPSGPRSW